MSATTEHGRALAALGSDYANATSRIYEQQGEAAARAAEQRGQIWGTAISRIGQRTGQAVDKALEAREDDQIKNVLQFYSHDIKQAMPDLVKINPDKAHKVVKQFYEQQSWAHELEDLQWKTDGRVLQKLREQVAAVNDQVGWSAFLAAAKRAGQNVSGYSAIYDGAMVADVGKKLEKAWQMHQGAAPKAPEDYTLAKDAVRISGTTNQPVAFGQNAGPNAKPDEPGMPAYGSDAYGVLALARQKEAAAAGGSPASGLFSGESGGMPQPNQQPVPAAPSAAPPIGAAPPASLSVAQVEGRAPVTPPPPPAPPKSTSAFPSDQATLAAMAERDAAKKKADTPTPGTFEHYLTIYAQSKGRPVDQLTTTDIETARKRYQQADDKGQDPTLALLRQLTITKMQQDAQDRIGQLPPAAQRRVTGRTNAFDQQPVVKRAAVMAEAVTFAQGMDPNTKNPADDQALLYAFAKAMDPESVVREGEYATVQKYAQSWASTYGFNAARIFSNSPFLTADARQNMKTTIGAKFEATRKMYDAVRSSFADQINAITKQPDGATYLTDYGAAFPQAPSTKTTTTPSGGPGLNYQDYLRKRKS